MTSSVGTGSYTYEVAQGWPRIPEGWETRAVADVAVDSQDRVFLFTRGEHPVMIFDREGNLLDSWGKGFSLPHAIWITLDDSAVFLVDRDQHIVMKFTLTGEHLMTIGTKNRPSDTGVTQPSADGYKFIKRGAGPFNMPAGVVQAPSGDIFVADGYGNCRVHKFTSDGKLLASWGELGTGPGQFQLPHGLWIDRLGRLLVADRENDRIQLFTQDGEFIEEWSDLLGPAQMFIDANDLVYVPEHNGCMFSILTMEGKRLVRWGSGRRDAGPGEFTSPHGVCGWTPWVLSTSQNQEARESRNLSEKRGNLRPGGDMARKGFRVLDSYLYAFRPPDLYQRYMVQGTALAFTSCPIRAPR